MFKGLKGIEAFTTTRILKILNMRNHCQCSNSKIIIFNLIIYSLQKPAVCTVTVSFRYLHGSICRSNYLIKSKTMVFGCRI